MDRLRVTVEGYDVGYYLAEEMGLALTWQAKLIDEINTFAISSTKTITLPLTNELKLRLNDPSELDTDNSISQKQKKALNVYVNDTVTVEGWIKLIRVVVHDLEEYIEFSLEPKEKNWITKFKEFSLTDLDYSDQDHELTSANIRTSEVYSPTRNYVYAPIDISEITRRQVLWAEIVTVSGVKQIQFYYIGSQNAAGTGGSFVAHSYGFDNTSLAMNYQDFVDVPDAALNGRGIWIARTTGSGKNDTKVYDQSGYLYFYDTDWQVADFYPCIPIRDILKRCFSRIGYQVELSSTFLNNYYNFLHNNKQLAKFDKDRNYFKVKVPDGGYTFTSLTAHGDIIMPYMNVSSAGFKTNVNYTDTDSDNSSDVLAGTNVSRYTFTENTIIRFSLTYEITFNALGGTVYINFNHYDVSNTLIKSYRFDQLGPNPTSGDYIYKSVVETGYDYYQTGDYITVTISLPTLLTSIHIAGNNTLESIMYEGGNFKGKEVRLNEYLPEVTAFNWIKDLALIHNLEFYTNEILKTVYVVPDSEKRSGKKIDFSNKLNRDREVEIEEVGSNFPKTLTFRWKKDSEDLSVIFVEEVLNYNITEPSPSIEFAEGIITNDNQFNTDNKEYRMSIYAPSFDKFEKNSVVDFNTVEMKVNKIWPSIPMWTRGDYEPRYLKLNFSQTIEDNLMEGVSSTSYTIEGDSAPLTYVRAEFQTPLYFDSLLETYYERTIKRINNGWIVRAYLYVNEVDVDGIANILKIDNDFRADYKLLFKGTEIEAELVKIMDYSPTNKSDTRIEFLIFKDLV